MKANPYFADQNISFWAYVRSISESLGYTDRKQGLVRDPSIPEMFTALKKLDQPADMLGTPDSPSELALKLKHYFSFRAETINGRIRSDLMVASEAQEAFEEVKELVKARPTGNEIRSTTTKELSAVEYWVNDSIVRIPLNKQKDEKKRESYLTGIVNLLVAQQLAGLPCDYDPRRIPTVDYGKTLYQTFSRRYDGSFPSTRNPIAMWEIKEYYYTTTFGSKISDTVYITSLDGYERKELERGTSLTIDHVVMVDAYDTWWGKGRPYLCRMIDILHMGHVDDILFGREVVRRLPTIAEGWADRYRQIPEGEPDDTRK